METIFPRCQQLGFFSPRYAISSPNLGNLPAYDNAFHTSLNGTYDRLFPLYLLTQIRGAGESYRPRVELINGSNSVTLLRGVCEPKIMLNGVVRRESGRKVNPHPTLSNGNLVLNTISYKDFFIPKFTPGWTTIQGTEAVPNYINNCLGDFARIQATGATELGKVTKTAVEFFPKGAIVKFNNNIWRCIEATRTYPPLSLPKEDETPNAYWAGVDRAQNIFNVDIYAFGSNGVEYTGSYEEQRTFVPSEQDDLVSWNISYFG